MEIFIVLIIAAAIAAYFWQNRPKRRRARAVGAIVKRTPLNRYAAPNVSAEREGYTTFICAVVGESFDNPDGTSRQKFIRSTVKPGMHADLEPEPENPYDSNAVAVYVAGVQIGYLKRDVAERTLTKMDEYDVDATIHEVHGGEGHKKHVGVTLQITIEDDEDDYEPEPKAPPDLKALARQERYELLAAHKDNLATMFNCCMQEELEFWSAPHGERRIPRPIFFQRVAILQRKARNYATEVKICERWIKIADAYLTQDFVKRGGGYPFEDTSPHLDIIKRIDKARELLAKQTN